MAKPNDFNVFQVLRSS